MFEDRRRKHLEEIPAQERTRPILQPGRIVATPGALNALTEAHDTGERYLYRHLCGDWGEVDAEDGAANDRAVREGTRILSAYQLSTQVKLWIITEWDRSITTLLLPDEY